MLILPSAAVLAEEPSSEERFQVTIVTGTSDPYPGHFLIKDEKLYVDLDTVLNMGEITQSFHVADEVQLKLEKNGSAVFYDYEELVTPLDGMYLPFKETMSGLYLNCSMPISHILSVESICSHEMLYEQLVSIIENSAYDMGNLHEDQFFQFGTQMAELLDTVKNLDFFSSVDGSKAYEHYQTAFREILLPQQDDDIRFLNSTENLVKTLHDHAELGEDVLKLFETTSSDFNLFVKGTETLSTIGDLDSLLQLYAQSSGLKHTEETALSGVEYILNNTSTNPVLMQAGNDTVQLLNNSTPLWLTVADDFVKTMHDAGEQVIIDTLLPTKKVLDAASKLTDLVFDTQNQVDAMIKAAKLLEIQNVAGTHLELLSTWYQECDDQNEKERCLKDMYDVTWIYLRSGIQAFRAVRIDDDMRAVCDRAITWMNEELDQMMNYSAQDFSLTQNIRDAEEMLKTYKGIRTDIETTPEASTASDPSMTSDEIVLTVTWNYDLDGVYQFVDVFLTGTMADGSSIERAPTEGCYIANENLIGTQIVHDGFCSLTLHNTAGFLSIEISNGDNWVQSGTTLGEIGIEAELVVPGDRTYDIDDEEQFLYRAPTGIWYYMIEIENGKVLVN